MSVRKAHNSGKNHLKNVVQYYQGRAPRAKNTLHGIIPCCKSIDTDCLRLEIGHEKAQSVIDSITSSYAAEGQASSNPMLQHAAGQAGYPPLPFGFPGKNPHILSNLYQRTNILTYLRSPQASQAHYLLHHSAYQACKELQAHLHHQAE